MRALAYVGARQSKVGDASRHHAHGVGDQLVASRDTTAAKHPLTLTAVARSAPSTGAPLLLCAKPDKAARRQPDDCSVAKAVVPAGRRLGDRSGSNPVAEAGPANGADCFTSAPRGGTYAAWAIAIARSGLGGDRCSARDLGQACR